MSPVWAARGPPRPPEARFSPRPTLASGLLSPRNVTCAVDTKSCQHLSIPSAYSCSAASAQSPAGHETAILDSSSQRPFQSRPSRAPLPSPSARPEPGLEPVVADWKEEGGMKNKAGGGGCGAG